MSPERKKCLICSLPTIAILAVLVSFAVQAAVSYFRLNEHSSAILSLQSRQSNIEQTVTEIGYIRKSIERMESKLDKHLDQK